MLARLDGDLDRVARVVRLSGVVNCLPDFARLPQVINGASDPMVELFGDAGRHARATIGAPAPPMNIAVEVDDIFEVRWRTALAHADKRLGLAVMSNDA